MKKIIDAQPIIDKLNHELAVVNPGNPERGFAIEECLDLLEDAPVVRVQFAKPSGDYVVNINELAAKITEVETSIDMNKMMMDEYRNGNPDDRTKDWYHKAFHYVKTETKHLKLLRTKQESLMRVLKQIRHEETNDKNHEQSKLFISIVKERYPEEFNRIWDQVHALIPNED